MKKQEKSKLIIHNLTDSSDIFILEYTKLMLKEVKNRKQELKIGDSRYFTFNTGIHGQLSQTKTGNIY